VDDIGWPHSGYEPPQSRWANLNGRVHYVDYGGPDGGPLLVLVHGLGGSLASWAEIAPALARSCRVLAIDLAGFGRTAATSLSPSLPANREMLDRFLVEVVREPAVLVGHSMGGTIAAMQASQNPETVAGLVLISPVVPWVRDAIEKGLINALATARQVIRYSDSEVPQPRNVRARMESSATSSRQTRDLRKSVRLVSQYFAVARRRGWGSGPSAELITAGRSLTWTLLRRRQFATMLSGVTTMVLWLHGDQDPLIPVRVARNAAAQEPTWSFDTAHGIGHEPHREAPGWTATRIEAWLNANSAAAGEQDRIDGRPHDATGKGHDA